MPATRTLYFAPDLFAFLRDLAAHNDRDWFQANKSRFEKAVKAPTLRFIDDLGDRLAAISPHFVADPRPVGGSMFRIHRDTRFAKDKSPYKTHIGAHFPHQAAKMGHGGKDASKAETVHAPGFYLHLEPGGCFVAAGMWRPEGPALGKVRDAIVERPAQWTEMLATGIELEGESLKKAPQGYDPAHELIADLKRKDFVTSFKLADAEVCNGDFMDRFVGLCTRTAPLVRFLAKAVDLPF